MIDLPKTAGRAISEDVHGVQVVTLEDQAFPFVRFVVAERRGAVADPGGKHGALTVMFEMLLRGTQRANRLLWNTEVEALGSSVDSQVGHEVGYIRGTALARHLKSTFDLVTEAIVTPAFDAEEWERLRMEACDIARLERDDDDAVADLFMREALYPHHPLGRSASGDVTSLESLTLDDLRTAHRCFARDNLLVAFAGAITPEQAAALVAPLAQALPEKAPKGEIMAALHAYAGTHLLVVDKAERTQVQLRVGAVALDAFHPDVDSFWLGVMAFGGTFTSPFTQQVRDERGWSYVAHADFRRRARYAAPMMMRCAPALEDAVDCLALNLELFAALAQGSLPDVATLQAARQYVLNRYPFEIATAYDRLGLTLGQILLGLPMDDALNMPTRLQAIALPQVARIMGQHLRRGDVMATLVAPAAVVLPQLRKRFPDAKVSVVDWRDGLGQRPKA